jgi:hypothetical protein
VECLALFPDLTHLELSRDLEIGANDQLDEDHDMAWYRRCFYRRFHASEQIFASCPRLQRCRWKQQPIDSEGNENYHNFVVVEDVRGSEKLRVVKPVMQWWMADHYKDEHGGDLPEDMVKENAYWEVPFEVAENT